MKSVKAANPAPIQLLKKESILRPRQRQPAVLFCLTLTFNELMGIEWTWGPLENYLSRQCCLIRMEMLKHILPQASTNRWNGLMMKLQMKTVNFSLSQSLRQEAFTKIPLHLLQRYPWADKAPILEKKASMPRGRPLFWRRRPQTLPHPPSMSVPEPGWPTKCQRCCQARNRPSALQRFTLEACAIWQQCRCNLALSLQRLNESFAHVASALH